MRRFVVQKQAENIRPSYKMLQDVRDLKISSYATIRQLGQEFLVTPLRVTEILREAEVWPVGKIPKRDPETQNKIKGKPELAYDPEAAQKAVRGALERGN